MARTAPWLLGAALLAATPAAAELVVLADGSVLKVVSYRAEGDRATMRLPSGGTLMLPLRRVERVVEDEVVPPGAVPLEPEVREVDDVVRFSGAAPVPDTPYGELIYAAAREAAVNPTLVAAMVRAESSFDPEAVSHKGARGLMQLMPATAERFGVRPEWLFDPEMNLLAGTRYLAWLVDRFAGELTHVLAAYNAGEANVDRYSGVPPFRETREYVRRVVRFLDG